MSNTRSFIAMAAIAVMIAIAVSGCGNNNQPQTVAQQRAAVTGFQAPPAVWAQIQKNIATDKAKQAAGAAAAQQAAAAKKAG
jgi:hypothetical protein